MNRLEKPLDYKVLYTTGDLLLRAQLDLWLKDSSGNWKREAFRVDSGSDITSMPSWHAKALGLPVPPLCVNLPVNTSAGQVVMPVRSGILRVRVDGLSSKEHVLPCHFMGDPAVPLTGAPLSNTIPRNLLGLSGVVDKFRILFDGARQSLAAPHGMFTFEEV